MNASELPIVVAIMKLSDPRWYQNCVKSKVFLTVILLINLLVIFIHKTTVSKGKVDWNDYKGIFMDIKRVGLGENGDPGIVDDLEGLEKTQHLSEMYGVSVLISDQVSDARALPDPRSPE